MRVVLKPESKIHRRTLTFVAFCVSLMLVFLLAPAIAQTSIAQTSSSPPAPVKVLQQQQQQIDQSRSQITQQRDRLQTQERSAQQNLTGLQGDMHTTEAQIGQNEAQIQAANQRLKTLEAQLVAAEKTYSRKQAATVARLRFLQQQQGSYGWAVLLESKNLNEFLDRRFQLGLLYQRDRHVLANLKTAADRLDRQRNEVETQKNEIAILTQTLFAQKADYQNAAQYQQGLITRLRQNRTALEAAEQQLAQDSQNLTALIQQRIAAESPEKVILRGTGTLTYPSDGIITSGFGYRMHPILGYVRFHSGLDFGADYGSLIRAADAGVVIFAGSYSGYGQAVIIDHGKNVTTLYGHTSEIYVREGQTVQRGQPIAAVGSSGLSTGPHLHFEVRLSGEPVDPATYL
jgi:murein DD-endopeptidase MepM/ murein hydrolase activator NlpD